MRIRPDANNDSQKIDKGPEPRQDHYWTAIVRRNWRLGRSLAIPELLHGGLLSCTRDAYLKPLVPLYAKDLDSHL